ncbi:MAG: hypothetical protein CL943_00570 [Candidatus Diapherotrites archaeon]|uniref:Uncharacterized protein n=1 Tax=Candidatus Iainarchaeum sp. TaxID=3101447 RepID=A0A2D6M031_9ARCH|nr:hypothetical protein [Candidatus Diapherotrites archaeon]|tara:strand:+ start:484 stop:675 length:192 start_codon:yes stop_codon:yes gene_type:complete
MEDIKPIEKTTGKKSKSFFLKGGALSALIGGILFAAGHSLAIAFIAAAVVFLVITAFFGSLFS